MKATFRAVGMTTPVGLTAASTRAAVRAGVSRLREHAVRDKLLEPIVTARLDDGDLPPIHHAVAAQGTSTERETRLFRLAGPALQEVVAPFAPGAAWPLFLALPEPRSDVPDPVAQDFVGRLATQAGVPLDLGESRVFRGGRAGGLAALADAADALAAGRVKAAIVGGVDTYDDLLLLRALVDEGRVQTSTPRDRMFPGEGAGFVVITGHERSGGLCATQGPLPDLGSLAAVGLGAETGHLYSKDVYRGEGLSGAFAALFRGIAPGAPPVRTVYASWNGEGFWAKEWGVAYVRQKDRFAERLRIEHPADCFGDTGAAAGPLLVGLGLLALRRGHQKGPSLVFCSSDREARGAALIHGSVRKGDER